MSAGIGLHGVRAHSQSEGARVAQRLVSWESHPATEDFHSPIQIDRCWISPIQNLSVPRIAGPLKFQKPAKTPP